MKLYTSGTFLSNCPACCLCLLPPKCTAKEQKQQLVSALTFISRVPSGENVKGPSVKRECKPPVESNNNPEMHFSKRTKEQLKDQSNNILRSLLQHSNKLKLHCSFISIKWKWNVLIKSDVTGIVNFRRFLDLTFSSTSAEMCPWLLP